MGLHSSRVLHHAGSAGQCSARLAVKDSARLGFGYIGPT